MNRSILVAMRDGAIVFARAPGPRGPMSGFGYDYFDDKWGDRPRPKLLSARARWGAGGYAYEALNLVDGRRTAQEIRDALRPETQWASG